MEYHVEKSNKSQRKTELQIKLRFNPTLQEKIPMQCELKIHDCLSDVNERLTLREC